MATAATAKCSGSEDALDGVCSPISESMSTAIMYGVQGFIVLALVALGVFLNDPKGTRMQLTALMFKCRMWMNKQQTGYAAVATPQKKATTTVSGGGRFGASGGRFGGSSAKPGRAKRTTPVQRAPSDEDEEDSDEPEPEPEESSEEEQLTASRRASREKGRASKPPPAKAKAKKAAAAPPRSSKPKRSARKKEPSSDEEDG